MSETEAPDAPSTAADQCARMAKQRNGILYRLRKRGYRKFPSWMPDPDYKKNLAMYREDDDEQNKTSEPPFDEVIDLRCIWAVEIYTPAHTDKLLDGFKTLGWDKQDSTFRNPNPLVWVQWLRESPYGGGWFNLGPISRQEDQSFLSDCRRAPLPPAVDYASGEIHGITSSITCIVIGFFIKEENSHLFETALRQKYRSYMERHARGYTIPGPHMQKEAAIRAIRADMQAMAANWFRRHLPGLFSSGILVDEFPTCEFVTLRRGRPFPRFEPGSRPDAYFYILGMDHDIDAWESSEIPGLKFAWPPLHDQESRFHAVLAATESDFKEERLRGYAGAPRLAYAAYLDGRVKGLLSRWALLAALTGFERHLNSIRDSSIFRRGPTKRPLKLLETFGSHVSYSVDISAVSVELCRYTQGKRSFAREVAIFKPSNPRFHREGEITLHEALREQIGERAAWLHNVDRSVRDLLVQYGTVLGARESIRLQRSVGFLTIFLALLTALMASLAVHENWSDIVQGLNQLLGSLES